MKKITKINLLLILAVLITSICNINNTYAQKAKAVITLKNNGASSANDAHITAADGRKFKTGHAPGFNPADKAPAGGSHTLDWPSSDNVTPIPSPGSIKIKVEFTDAIGGFKSDSCWLTFNGVPLSTGVSYVFVDAFKTSPNSGNIRFTNTDPIHPWIVTNCLLYIDNPIDPLNGPDFVPSGIPLPLATFTIPASSIIDVPYSFTNPAFFVGVQFITSRSGYPEIYEGSMSELQSVQAVSPIPTLSEWALIIFGLMLITLGIIYIRKRRLISVKSN